MRNRISAVIMVSVAVCLLAACAQETPKNDAVSGTETEREGGIVLRSGEEETVTVLTDETTAIAEFNMLDEEDAEDEDAQDEAWSGVYMSETGEALTITAEDAEQLRFSFETAGISGVAQCSGNQAVYHGDDDHIVVFDRDRSVIEVSVQSAEDYDTEASPLIGIYVKKSA